MIPDMVALMAVAMALLPLSEEVAFRMLNPGVLEERLRLASQKPAERFLHLRALFEKTGCPDLREQKVRGSKEPNLICVVGQAPEGARRVVVGAHFDAAGGDGLIDNWTGAILLPSLAEFIREKPRRHEFHFVGFAAEERGLWGSEAYLKSIPKQERSRVAGVVTMDSLGLSPTKWWPNGSDPQLAQIAARLARAMKLEFAGVNIEQVGSTDSATFHRVGIPVLSLHSVTQETLPVLNSKRDKYQALSWPDYYDTHRFVSALLVYLDQQLP